MQITQIVQSSADVLTITKLAPGNVYKRLETDYVGNSTLRFGVVQSIMNNGEECAVSALEYVPDYQGGAKAELKVFNGAKPVAIFPATPDEIIAHFQSLEESTDRAVKAAKETLHKAEEARAAVRHLAATTGYLTAPETAAGELDVADAIELANDGSEG